MGGQHDDAVFLAGETHDEVAHGDRTDGRVGGEGIFLELVVLELAPQKLLGFRVSRAGGPARANGYKLAGIGVGFGAVKVRLGLGSERSPQ